MNTKTNNKKAKIIIPVTVLVIIAAAIAFVLVNNKKQINEQASAVPQGVSALPVKISIVSERKIDNSLSFTGSFEARKSLPLVAEAQGSIIQLNLKEGQRVGAGQVIARLDPTTIQSNLATAKASYNNAVKNSERYERLVKAGAISQKQYEDVALNVENVRADVAAIQQQMKYTIIRSPMSGIIGEVKVEQGSFATLGMQIGTVVDISRLKMVLKVPEEDVIKLKQGQSVTIKTDVYPDHLFKGNITLISVQADAGRKYDVEVEVMNDNKFPLKAGMFGTAMLNAQNADETPKLFIPRNAIVGSIKDAEVFVVNDDRTVTAKHVEVENQSGEDVIVLSGLTAGEKVVTSGQINLQNGKKVRVVTQ